MRNPEGPYIVWTDYGYEGWSPDSADSFEDALSLEREQLSLGNRNIVITKLVIVKKEEV